MAEEEARDLLPGPPEIVLGVVSGSNEVPQGFVVLTGDPDGSQLADTKQLCQANGVTAISFDVVSRTDRRQGRCDDNTGTPSELKKRYRPKPVGPAS